MRVGARVRQPAVDPAEPEPASEVNETRTLYQPVPQIASPKVFEVEWLKLTPRKMAEWLRAADADEEFRQRATTVTDIKRWTDIIDSNRFVHFLPAAPLCSDPDGHLLNGKHRLTAGAACGKPLGFMVVRNVPRFMHRFFDTPKQLTLDHILQREGHTSNKGQTGTTLRLALRYEELLHGIRPGFGWNRWSSVHDEPTDLENLFLRRGDLFDLVPSAVRAHRGKGAPGCRLVVSALAVFRFYQQLAWPAGIDVLDEFWEGLTNGAMLPLGSPAKTLREWGEAQYDAKETWKARRETHLLVLLQMFAAHAAGKKLHRVQWAYGIEIPAPYHPDGPDAALDTVLSALADLDKQNAVSLT